MMNDIRTRQVMKDAATIEEAMKKYSGSIGAHFGFIAYATGERQFMAGGNAAISGICLAEAITTLIESTPGLDETFIDIIADTVKDQIRKKGQIQ